MLLYQILASTIYEKKSYTKTFTNNTKHKESAPTWNGEVKLLGSPYSVSDIEEYFEYIIKKHETATDNPPIRTYVNKLENRIIFEIKRGYYPEILTPETMKLLGSTKNKIIKDENVPHLEITEVVLVH